MNRRKKNIVELTRCSVAQYKALEKLPVIVLADNVRSLYNIGAVFRTADAFRISGILLCGISGSPPHPEITKTALGAEESVDWSHAGDAVEEVLRLKDEGWKICVLEQTHGSEPLYRFERNPEERYVLVIGNEVEGVDQRIVDLADHVLEIPQEGTKHSLNVSVSAGIALHQMVFSVGVKPV